MAEWTQSDLDEINQAIKSGAASIRFSDKQVTYRGLDEMLRIRAVIRQSLGLTKKTKRVFTTFDKGHNGDTDE